MAAAPILVIEDDLDLRNIFEAILEHEGFQVLKAANGQEALEILRNGSPKPTLILLDLMMPVMDGYSFREVQKNDPSLKDIPVVIMSADGHVEEKLKRVGSQAYMKKPVGMQELLDTVRRFAA
jgi:CheY-like chemotaxis protein